MQNSKKMKDRQKNFREKKRKIGILNSFTDPKNAKRAFFIKIKKIEGGPFRFIKKFS